MSLVTATAASSLIACFLMGWFANLPVALASGMGAPPPPPPPPPSRRGCPAAGRSSPHPPPSRARILHPPDALFPRRISRAQASTSTLRTRSWARGS